MNFRLLQVEYHRNGVAGNGFHVVTFIHDHTVKVGVVFKEKGDVAVLDVALLAKGIIGQPNKWRGDDFENDLRKAIERSQSALIRYSLSNGERFIEFEKSEEGYAKAIAYRKAHPIFYRQRIKEVLQMRPDNVAVECEYFHH